MRHVLGEEAKSETIERLAQLSEGNAFYLEELIRCAAEGRKADLPVTVVAMVQSRLGKLDEELRRILRAASVFGEVFWTGGVAALLGGVERKAAARERLTQLMEREVLLKRGESRFPEEEEYAFRHALLREGAYVMLTEEDRTLGHRLAGEWLEACGEKDELLLAEHFEKGGDRGRAAHHYRRAASGAYLAGDSIAAVAYAHRGLACAVSDEQRIALLGLLCEAQFWHIELIAAVLPQAEELLRLAPRASAPWIQGMVIKLNAARLDGRIDDFAAVLEDMVALQPSPEAAHPLGVALGTGVVGLDHLGNVERANAIMSAMASTGEALHDHLSELWLAIYGMRGMRNAYAEEDPTSAIVNSAAALAVADAIGHLRYRQMCEIFTGMNWWFLGASAEAERALLSLDVFDEELAYVSSCRPFVLAWLLADRGSLSEAEVWASRLATSGQARRLSLDEGRGRWVLSEVQRRAGQFEAAHAEINAALPLLKTICPLDVPGALATQAALYLAQGRTRDAVAAAEEGLARYTSMGACSQFFRGAFLRLVHAECLYASGDHGAARAAIEKARARVLANAERIKDPAHLKSFLENVDGWISFEDGSPPVRAARARRCRPRDGGAPGMVHDDELAADPRLRSHRPSQREPILKAHRRVKAVGGFEDIFR